MIGSRLRWVTAVCTLMFFVALAFPALAAPARKPILEMIPKEVAGFVVLSDVSKADKAAETLAAKTQFPIPGPTMILQAASGLGDVVDAKGGIAAMYFAQKEVRRYGHRFPPAVFLFPIKDFEKFRDAFEGPEKVEDGLYRVVFHGMSMFLASKDGYAVLAPDEDRATLDLVLKGKASIVAEVQPWKKWIDEQVAYGFITQTGLKSIRAGMVAEMSREYTRRKDKEYMTEPGVPVEEEDVEETEIIPPADDASYLPGEQVFVSQELKLDDAKEETRAAREKKEALRLLREKEEKEEKEWKATKKAARDRVLEMYDSIDLLGAGAKVDVAGVISVSFRCGLKPGSALSKTAKNAKRLEGDLLAPLPQGDFVIAGGGPMLHEVGDFFRSMTKATFRRPIRTRDGEYVMNIPFFDTYRGALKGQTWFVGVPQEKKTIVGQSCAVSWTGDPAKAFEDIKTDLPKLEKELNTFLGGAFRENEEFEEVKLPVDPEAPAPERAPAPETAAKADKDKDIPEAPKKKKKVYFKATTETTTISGCKTLVVTYDFSEFIKRAQEDMPGQIEGVFSTFLESVFGKGNKIVEYNIQLDDHRILSTYCRDAQAREKIVQVAKTGKGGLADDPEIKKIVALLPTDAQWKMLWSPYGTAEYFHWYMDKLIMPMLGQMMQLGKLPRCEKMPPVGIAGVGSETIFEMTAVIPPKTLCNSILYIMKVREFLSPLTGGMNDDF